MADFKAAAAKGPVLCTCGEQSSKMCGLRVVPILPFTYVSLTGQLKALLKDHTVRNALRAHAARMVHKATKDNLNNLAVPQKVVYHDVQDGKVRFLSLPWSH